MNEEVEAMNPDGKMRCTEAPATIPAYVCFSKYEQCKWNDVTLIGTETFRAQTRGLWKADMHVALSDDNETNFDWSAVERLRQLQRQPKLSTIKFKENFRASNILNQTWILLWCNRPAVTPKIHSNLFAIQTELFSESYKNASLIKKVARRLRCFSLCGERKLCHGYESCSLLHVMSNGLLSNQKAILKRCHGFKFAVKTFRCSALVEVKQCKSYTMPTNIETFVLLEDCQSSRAFSGCVSCFFCYSCSRNNKWFAINQISRYHSPRKAFSPSFLLPPRPSVPSQTDKSYLSIPFNCLFISHLYKGLEERKTVESRTMESFFRARRRRRRRCTEIFLKDFFIRFNGKQK